MYECTFVILGATGDLTKRKLIPAIYRLIRDKELSKFAIIGAALPNVSVKKLLDESKKFVKKVDGRVWKRLESHFYYHQLDFYKLDEYISLKEEITKIEKKHKLSGNRLFYLAAMPEHFSILTKNLDDSGIVKQYKDIKGSISKRGKWARIVYEKPFGYDLKSSRAINKNISRVFDESQIYRIDHYLGKELVGDIALVRFTNRIFEPLWNNKHIDSIQVVLSEKMGIEGRGNFYESTGAINDMLQSHMLQIMALVSMEAPRTLSGKDIRDAKARVLKKIKVDSAVIGQYKGYRSEPGVKRGSSTETFVAAKLKIDNKRWRGVPFYLKTGKYLDKNATVIHIRFKMVKCLLDTCPSESNYLTIVVQSDEGFYLGINSKIPGKYEVTPVRMDFCHSCLFGPNTPAAYEILLLDVIKGDQSVFLRRDEIEASWKIVDKIKAKRLKLHQYEKGSAGPKVQDELDARWI